MIYHTLDGGDTWAVDDRFYVAGVAPVIRTVFFSDSVDGWIGFGERNIARTTDGGENWQLIEIDRRLVQALDGDVAFVSEYFGAKIFGTTDGGDSWEEIYPGIDYSLSRAEVSFISQTEGWATISWTTEYTHGSLLMYTQDGGVNWDTLLAFDDRDMREIHMLTNREGWVHSDPPQSLLHTTDGVTWQEDPLPDIGGRVIHDLIVLPGPHAWIVAGGLILKREGD